MAEGFTLYQLTSDYKRFTEMVENGEISAEDMQDTLDGLAEDINTKLDNTCGYIKSLEAQVDALKKAKDEFDVDLSASILIGDKPSDMQAGKAAGIKKCYKIDENQDLKSIYETAKVF